MLPNVGGHWDNTANAGVFNVNLNNTSSNANIINGARAVRLRHNHAQRRALRGTGRAVLKGGSSSLSLRALNSRGRRFQ